MSSKRSTMIGNFASACSFGPLWVSPSLRQTVAETPSSVFLAPQPPPSGPKLPMKNSDVFGLKPWKLGATRSAWWPAMTRSRDRRLQRLEDGVDDGHREAHPQPHRRRPRRADDAARRDDDLEAAERAVVDRIVGRRGDALVGDLGAAIAGGDRGVVEAAHLLRHVGQVDGHLLALDRDLDLDRDALADVDAVVVEPRLRLVDAVRDGLGAGAGRGLGAVHDLGDRIRHRLRGRSGRAVRGSAARRSSPR